MAVHTRSGTQLIAELPPGDWRLTAFGYNCLVATCPDHEPRFIREDGTIEVLKIGDERIPPDILTLTD